GCVKRTRLRGKSNAVTGSSFSTSAEETARRTCDEVRWVPVTTHRDPSPTAIASGVPPVRALGGAAWPVVGSMRDTVRSSAFSTHTEPSPAATAPGVVPTPSGAPTSFDVALIATTELPGIEGDFSDVEERHAAMPERTTT